MRKVTNKELYDQSKLFKDIWQGNGLQIVFKFDPTSDVLYGVEALDINQYCSKKD